MEITIVNGTYSETDFEDGKYIISSIITKKKHTELFNSILSDLIKIKDTITVTTYTDDYIRS